METKHTPTPWSISEIDGAILGLDAQGYGVAVLDMDWPTSKANAAFIVRACNAHDELVQMLQIHHDSCIRTQPQYNETGDDRVAYRATVNALAKARGETV